MLDKLVVHLKNILFFKATVYIITIIILISVVAPLLTSGLLQASHRKEQSKLALTQAEQKLQSIKEFEKNIEQTTLDFNELVQSSKHQGCFNRNYFINSLKPLEHKHNLAIPISIGLSRIFADQPTKKNNDQIRVNDYEVIIDFQTDKSTVLSMIEDICATLPAGSIITDVEIKKISVITPSFVTSLSTKNSPGLFKVKVRAHLREVVYEE
jgi:hypothetical protein